MARARTPEGPPPAPPVQKLRIRYAKRSRLRFSSTRDFSRGLERALRRAAVPMAYSAGFHPHPRISYANGAPTGAASEAEYLEISVTERVDPESVRVALDAALPEGIDILEVVQAGPGSLADRLEASEWRIELAGIPADVARTAVATFLARDEVLVSRMVKAGERTFDARRPVVSLGISPDSDDHCAILRVVVRHTTPAVRPDDILTALHAAAELSPPVPAHVTRLAQGPLLEAGDAVADPLAPDKDVVGT